MHYISLLAPRPAAIRSSELTRLSKSSRVSLAYRLVVLLLQCESVKNQVSPSTRLAAVIPLDLLASFFNDLQYIFLYVGHNPLSPEACIEIESRCQLELTV